MKIIAIGDTHGRDKWKQIIARETFDKVVFIGDYFDSWGLKFETQIDNFQEILAYKKENLERVVLLIGNHDFHYLSYAQEQYSGYQDKYAPQIGAVIQAAIDEGLLQVAFESDEFLFTHAGVTNTWVSKWISCDMDTVEQFINDTFLNQPEAFRFCGRDNTGDDITQSPMFVRPKSLCLDGIQGYTQVVGHTTVDLICTVPFARTARNAWLIDAIGTSKEYLVIDNGKVEIKNYENTNTRK